MSDQGTGGLLSPYLRKQRFKAVRPFICGSVLDIGCASGDFCQEINGLDYVGFDIDTNMVEIAARKFQNRKFVFEIPKTGSFGTIVALAVIEHVKEPLNCLAHLATLLEDDGRIVITTPHPRGRLVHDMGASLGIFSKEAADEHEEFFTRQRMLSLSKDLGLRIEIYKTFLFGFNQLFVLRKT